MNFHKHPQSNCNITSCILITKSCIETVTEMKGSIAVLLEQKIAHTIFHIFCIFFFETISTLLGISVLYFNLPVITFYNFYFYLIPHANVVFKQSIWTVHLVQPPLKQSWAESIWKSCLQNIPRSSVGLHDNMTRSIDLIS